MITIKLGGAALLALSLGVLGAANEGAGHEYDNIKLDAPIHSDEKLLPATLSIDFAKPVRSYDRMLFGLSYDHIWNDKIKIAEVAPGNDFPVISPQFQKVAAGVPFPLNRVFFTKDNWKKSLGPLSQRQPHQRVSWEGKALQVTGPAELIKAILKLDPAAKFDICLEHTADIGDLAEFLVGNANTVWGKKRVEYGLADPVNVAVWELGNEMDWSTGKVTVEEYIKYCRNAIAAVRKVQPDAKFAVHAATAPWAATQSKNWKNWHQTLLREMPGEFQYFAFHPYYHGYPVSFVEKYMDTIDEDIRASKTPEVKIFVSEHGKWPEGKTGRWEDSWYQTHALTGCLAVADFMMRMLQRDDIALMTMHSTSSGPWGMFYPDDYSKKAYATGLAELFKFFQLIPWGSPVLASSMTGDYTDTKDGKLMLSSLAVRGADGKLYVLLLNRLPETGRTVSWPGNDRWQLAGKYILTADSLDSVNTLIDKPIAINYVKGDNATLKVLEVPSRSLVLYVLTER